MAARLNILILGGTSEASTVARLMEGDDRFAPLLSLAGRTKAPVLPKIAHRVGGFGGIAGLTAYLADAKIDVLVDATHPFAAQMSRHAVSAARQAGIALLAVRRPPWQAREGDRWHLVGDLTAAAAALGERPRRVFLTIGRNDLTSFPAPPQHWYLIRSVDPPPQEVRPPSGDILTARGPFREADERRLLENKRIDVLVTKNSGAAATRAKLDAARALSLPVIMVERPVLPAAEFEVADAAEAFTWLCERAASHC